ncbi:ABC transporter ATP-binding protein [Paenibacillus guangzhouensis]|uniref:ABC transporter ATP-binding protein n=1 Tax=Paenibacillus guangzhouensis TaxID=1473112 RepID=UPI001266CFE5|nr:ABC transporter ATP-binding protein [Paenibacillus guangzhouensis]
MNLVKLENVSLAYEKGTSRVSVLRDIDVSVAEGEFITIVGPSGCGKSSLLALLAGTLRPSSGQVLYKNIPIVGTDPQRGILLQQAALFPWLSALRNVAYGLHMQGVAKTERLKQASVWLSRVGLEAFANRYPYELSGGMKQRVALARTLITNPELILMDEPLGALDAFTKRKMHELFAKVWRETGKTFIMVTHDVEEAVKLGTRMIVMCPRPGRIMEQFMLEGNRVDAWANEAEPSIVQKVYDLLRYDE